MLSQLASAAERQFIDDAVQFLESPSTLLTFSEKLGRPIEKLQAQLPKATRKILHMAVDRSLKTALKLAIETIATPQQTAPSDWATAAHNTKISSWAHTAAVTTTGAIGGAMGLGSLLIELPLSTSIILRAISSAAQEWGEDLSKPETQMQCLYVFALGSNRSSHDDDVESAYFASRVAFHKILKDAAAVISQRAAKDLLSILEKESLPVFVRFFSMLAPAFEKTVARKIISESIPIVGAIGGAAINAAFCNYFTNAARYHFGLMHLEKKYGSSMIHNYYRASAERHRLLLAGA